MKHQIQNSEYSIQNDTDACWRDADGSDRDDRAPQNRRAEGRFSWEKEGRKTCLSQLKREEAVAKQGSYRFGTGFSRIATGCYRIRRGFSRVFPPLPASSRINFFGGQAELGTNMGNGRKGETAEAQWHGGERSLEPRWGTGNGKEAEMARNEL